TTETCNNIDDDCDGQTDNGLSMTCGSGVGACHTGLSYCTAGMWGTCMGEVRPTTESCNNVDDDCDGVVDNGLSRVCGSNVGACHTGTEICAAGAWGACMGSQMPVTETCNNIDD